MSEEQKMSSHEAREAMTTLPIIIREAGADDVSFLFSSWLKSFRAGTMNRHVDNTLYFDQHHKLIERILKYATVKVACDEKNRENILGYICYEKIDGILVIHYAYTKHLFRKLGIQSQLAKTIEDHDFKMASAYTHMTNFGQKIASTKNLIYHPYILINYDMMHKEDKK
jgi:hypothetical protein